jgi:outer membrane protein assembly factor BamB
MLRSLVGCFVLLSSLALAAPVPKEGTTPFAKWTVTEDPVTNEMHNPLVVKDLVVVGTDNGALCAYKAENGEPVWTHTHGKRIFHRPAGDGERVYFTTESEVTAVTADAGKKVWSFPLAQRDGPVLAVPKKGLVYAADHTGTLYALDAKTGEKKWTADFAADAPPDPPGFSGDSARFENTKARPTAVSSDGETIFLSVFDQCRVVAFDAASGKRAWALQTRGWVYGTAVATPTHVFVGSQDKHFYCADKKTGKEVWKFETKGRVESGGAVDDRYVYFGSCDGGLYCLSQADGKERWRFDTDRYPDGKKSSIYSVPVLRQGAVYFAAGEGQFYALTADTGTARARLRPVEKSEMYCSAATDGRSFFITTRPSSRNGGASSLVAISLK